MLQRTCSLAGPRDHAQSIIDGQEGPYLTDVSVMNCVLAGSRLVTVKVEAGNMVVSVALRSDTVVKVRYCVLAGSVETITVVEAG